MRRAAAFAAGVLAVVMLLAAVRAASAAPEDRKPRQALFVGIDTSGSFRNAGYDDGLSFVAYYIYGHLNQLGGLK
ncbi:MAG: hypothetical protein ACREJG_02850, partial [Candidatus Rokuibacteriota bacterium]